MRCFWNRASAFSSSVRELSSSAKQSNPHESVDERSLRRWIFNIKAIYPHDKHVLAMSEWMVCALPDLQSACPQRHWTYEAPCTQPKGFYSSAQPQHYLDTVQLCKVIQYIITYYTTQLQAASCVTPCPLHRHDFCHVFVRLSAFSQEH